MAGGWNLMPQHGDRSGVHPKPWARGRGRSVTRWLLAALYFGAGVLHLAIPAPFLGITPAWVPAAPFVIMATGLAELAGAIALVQRRSPPVRRAAGWGLAAYALCVWPANVNHLLLDMARADHGLGWIYHGPRMVLQPVLIWAALWSSGAIGGRRSRVI
ncbi:Uncharacterized membrane protein [Sphingomonas sp. OV641]|uniref:DoxX family protein n=1 Tax=Sphingomonas sp. OV641 TaxID=1881068 RepID=UPI0008B41518|nr:Uncharacterized membrane protein [Sphingomonas sp. OV641]